MALSSMTGFGRAEVDTAGVRVTVELSAVNRRQLDFRLTIPRPLAALESRILKRVGREVSRGGVNATVTVHCSRLEGEGRVSLDLEKTAAYVEALRTAGRALNLPGDVTVETLLRLPADVFSTEDMTQDAERVWGVLERALDEALAHLLKMRRAEGMALERDIAKRIARLRRQSAQVARLAPSVTRRYRANLMQRIAAMKLEAGPSGEQVAREVAMFAERCDISEEGARLLSHFDQAETLMASFKPAGRALDFLCQEMLREINTIGSKANDARLTQRVIEMKSGLECIREQVQNIE